MRLANFESPGGASTWGRVTEDGLAIQAPRGVLADRGLHEVIDQPAAELSEAIDAAGIVEYAIDEVHLAAPISQPSKIISVGRNYREHIAEMGNDEPTAPILFGVLPSAISGPFDEIELPRDVTEEVDWEGELAVVIGRRARGVSRAHAVDIIAGYTVVNDVTARDLQRADRQWTRAKSFDSFKPMGPWITTVDELGLAPSLALEVTVNGVRKQSSTTDHLIFSVDVLVEYISAFCTLLPGDIIATGTPSGVASGENPPPYLKPGDVLVTNIEGIGALRNPVVAQHRDMAGAHVDRS